MDVIKVLNTRILRAILFAFIMLAAWFFYTNYSVGEVNVATVNGIPITQRALDQKLESRYGTEILEAMISEMLIKQEAATKGITVSEDEVSNRFNYVIDAYGSQKDLDRWLRKQGMSKSDVYEQLEFQIITEKILGKQIKQPAESELQQKYDELKDSVYKGKSYGEVRPVLEQSYTSMQIGSLMPSLIKGLRDKAEIEYFGRFKETEKRN